MSAPSAASNWLLGSLSPEAYGAVAHAMKHMEFRKRDVPIRMNDPVERIFFPVEGMLSAVVYLEEGCGIEGASVGREGVAGAISTLAGSPSIMEYIVQVPGSGYWMSPEAFREIYDAQPEFRAILNRYFELTAAYALQSLACIGFHPVEARLCRWLLSARDTTGLDQLPLTQEFLSHMLGVQRTTVTMTAQALERAGLIHYRRGTIDLHNIAGLKQNACECYENIRRRRQRAFPQFHPRDEVEVMVGESPARIPVAAAMR
jgi:CRP-like cAMP-binding protein